MKRGRSFLVGATIAAMILSACVASGTGDEAAALEAATEQTAPAADYVGTLRLDPRTGPAGTVVNVVGEGFPSSTTFDLTWGSAVGSWLIQGEAGEEYHGRKYTPITESLAEVTSSPDGVVNATFEVPSGWGFGHDVALIDEAGVIRNQALFNVEMAVSISPTEGPVGTPITITVEGMGWQTLENNRTVIYDNRYTGWISAVTTGGNSAGVIPATGEPGIHRIQVARGAYTFPYLNPQQSPRPDIPVFEFTFTVTDEDPILPAPIADQAPAAVLGEPGGDDTWIATDYVQGPVGTPLTLVGEGFNPGTEVEFIWYKIVGNRVSGSGWDEAGMAFGTATADSEGAVSLATEVPGDVGGTHRIEATVKGVLEATTSFQVTPEAMPLASQTVKAGDDIVIDLEGVGWTETANIYALVYDNAYLGYACGFNSQGYVNVTLKATGGPGWHFVDLYPAIYRGKEAEGQQTFRIPQLNYFEDHPGEDLPAFHYAFYVEG
ncbi:MAG: hypothetical protein JJE47_12980 [Acidimicrobiia bacterium]|nr:hypothetical protein [Acidimicrobiia bacterium]